MDLESEVLKSYVTKTRDKAAALKFIKKAMKQHRSPEVIVTDGLKSYPAALREVGAIGKQVNGRRLNNRQNYKDLRSAALAEWKLLMA